MKARVFLLFTFILVAANVFGQVTLLNKMSEKKHGVLFCTISSNGEYIATSGNDNDIVLWNTSGGNIIKRFTGIDKWTKSLRISDDGKYLVSGSKDFKVVVWDIPSGTMKFSLSGHSGDVNSVDISYDGRLIASGSSDKTIKIWDLNTGQLIKTLVGNSNEINYVDFSPVKNCLVSASSDGSLKIWDVESGNIIKTMDAQTWSRCAIFDPTGSIIASSGNDKKVKIWDSSTGALKNTFTGHTEWVQSLSFSPDGQYLISGSHDLTFIIWNVANGIITFKSPKQSDVVYSVCFNPNGKSVLVSNLFKVDLGIWDVSPLNIKGSVNANSNYSYAATTSTQPQTQTVDKQTAVLTGSPNIQVKGLTFFDPNRNNQIEADEQTSIEFTVQNTGNAVGKDLRIQIKDLANVQGIVFNSQQAIGDLQPGQEKKIVIPVKSTSSVVNGKVLFNITILEGRGFDSSPIELAINTKQFDTPLLVVQDYKFLNSGNEKINRGSKVKLKVVVQNRGFGVARNVNVRFNLPENAFIVSEPDYYIPEMAPNAIQTLDLELMTNKRYDKPELSVDVVVSENTGRFGQEKTISTPFEDKPSGANVVNLQPTTTGGNLAITDFSLSSDVDKNIPESNTKKTNIYALIIGNEDYSTYQQDLSSEVNVEFARNDAQVFKEYVNKTLGVPVENIMLLLDAKIIEMNRSIEKLNLIAKNANGDCELIFYYAGHGMPDEVTKEAYIMPVDVSGTDLKYAVKINDLYKKLTQYPAKKVSVFLDACFSGGARNSALVAARGVKVKPKIDALNGNIVVFTASSGEQSSLPYKEKQHGMFTYYLLKKLQETSGNVTYSELSDYVTKEVSLKSVIVNNKEQNPQTNTGQNIEAAWKNWKPK